MKEILDRLKQQLGNDDDIVTKIMQIQNKEIGIIYLKSTSDIKNIFLGIISPLKTTQEELTLGNILTKVVLIPESEIIQEDKMLEYVLKHKTLVIVKGESGAVAVDCEMIVSRQPSEPPTSANIYGPREGFTENINTNITLLRKRFPCKNFVFKTLFVGTETQTKVAIMYLKNVANKSIVRKIENKIKNIKIDGIIDAYYIATFLKERPYSLFEQVAVSEKPDIVAGKILEGRVAICVDGSPVFLTLPYLVFEDFQNSNDYYSNYIYVTLIRIVRLFGVIFATIVPGLYLSFRLYHYKLLPINLIITIANSTQNLPFTPLVELTFILLLFHMLYEVSLRLPQYLGLATSIVGALILGDTGVKAGLISPPGVIIIALSIISIYTVPNQASQMNVLRIVFLALGAMFGILGIMAGTMYVINYLSTLTEYTAPYLAPYGPKNYSDLKDGVFKKPLVAMKIRPKSFYNNNKRRQKWNIN